MSKDQDLNLFAAFPGNFYHVFFGVNRELMQQALSKLYTATKYGTSYTLTFEEACDLVEEVVLSADFSVDAGEEVLDGSRGTAQFVLRRLKSCGWLLEEVGENYQRFLHFQDYAVDFLQAVRKISSRETEEYSGFIYTIYQLLKSVDSLHGDIALERAYSNTEDLFRQLASLNTNIKKYIQRLVDEENKDDLRALMSMLLEEYQVKVVDRSYYNLTTKDNPEKYRAYVLDRMIEIGTDTVLMDSITRQRAERKGETYEEAFNRIQEQMDYIEICFESIDGLMDEIDHKNNRYIHSALARITFLLEAHDDLEGKINRVLKALLAGRIEPSDLFSLYRVIYLDDDSLYTPKKKRLHVKQSFADEPIIDEEALRSFQKLLAQERRFSRKNVEGFFLDQLKDKDEILASDLAVSSFDEFTFMVLGYLYASDENSPLCVINEDQEIHANGYRFRQFRFRRRNNG